MTNEKGAVYNDNDFQPISQSLVEALKVNGWRIKNDLKSIFTSATKACDDILLIKDLDMIIDYSHFLGQSKVSVHSIADLIRLIEFYNIKVITTDVEILPIRRLLNLLEYVEGESIEL